MNELSSNLANRRGEKKEKKKVFIAIMLAFFIVVSIIVATILAQQAVPPTDEEEGPSDEFGDETMEGEFRANAKVLTRDGNESASEVTPMSDPPEEAFSDDFETGDFNKWTSYSSPPQLVVTTEKSYEGDRSAKFDPTPSSAEYLKKSGAFSVEGGEKLHLYFATYINDAFLASGSSSAGEFKTVCLKDYFVAKMEFNNGKKIVYLISGMYSAVSNEKVVDIRSQVTAQDDWVGIAIENIQNDYQAQFGEEMPAEGGLRFIVQSKQGVVFLDDVILKKTPITVEGNYWSLDGVPVVCFFVVVDFKLIVSECVNESNVWVEINLWITIRDPEGNDVKKKTFAQEALVNVSVFDEWIAWMSICFDFPEDDTVYGGELTYVFDISIEAFGQIEDHCPDGGSWVGSEASKDGFDSFTVVWVNYDGYIVIVIGSVAGGFGVTGTAIGVRSKKKKRGCACDPSVDAECKC